MAETSAAERDRPLPTLTTDRSGGTGRGVNKSHDVFGALSREASGHKTRGSGDETRNLSPEQRVEMSTRGSLQVSDRAVERIAAAAVLEVPGVAPAETTTGALGSTLGHALGRAYPRIDVRVAGQRVNAEVDIVTHWPRPAAQIAAAVRDNVAERLHSLADLKVDTVEVHVAKAIRRTAPERKRVQ